MCGFGCMEIFIKEQEKCLLVDGEPCPLDVLYKESMEAFVMTEGGIYAN